MQVEMSVPNPLAPIIVFDIDGVVRDVGNSYRRALADTVEHFTNGVYRPSQDDIDALKSEGIWNNDWEASRELVYRYFEESKPSEAGNGITRDAIALDYETLVAFFQSRYRGTDPVNWNGYICQEPLLMGSAYLESLTHAGMRWGFFSGATTGSARYVLERRLGLRSPVLVAMEDAPGKPDPTGLFQTVNLLTSDASAPVIYVGDTVADMYTVKNARQQQPERPWIGVGVLPPHVQTTVAHQQTYGEGLQKAGAAVVLQQVESLTPEQVAQLVQAVQ